LADGIEYYRGYELAFYWRGRDKVTVQIREKDGLPPIHHMPRERTSDAARQAAWDAVNEMLASLPPKSN
jgi:hypothetical protein